MKKYAQEYMTAMAWVLLALAVTAVMHGILGT